MGEFEEDKVRREREIMGGRVVRDIQLPTIQEDNENGQDGQSYDNTVISRNEIALYSDWLDLLQDGTKEMQFRMWNLN